MTSNKNNKSNEDFPSEFRMDLVSNDWVIIATGRARRPESFAEEKRNKKTVPKSECPFCQAKNLEKRKAQIDKDGKWFAISIPNKYPALSEGGGDFQERKQGPNRILDGFGYHEVIVYRNHDKLVAEYSPEEMRLLIDMYQKRYLDLIYKDNIKFVSIFHNHGEEAGASVAHPHSQILAIPIMDPDLRSSVDGAESFYRSQGKCVYCTMIDWDIKSGSRIIYENERFVVLCPFAPQVSFEVRVYPKEHQPHFETSTESDKALLADALSQALGRIHKALDDPAYNFYIHTAPRDGESYSHYHWHINILPKTAIWAGFELGSGIEISTVEPEQAAEFLRKQEYK